MCQEYLQYERCLPQYIALLHILSLLLSSCPASIFRFKFQETFIPSYRLYYGREELHLPANVPIPLGTSASRSASSSSPRVDILAPFISRQVRLSPTPTPTPSRVKPPSVKPALKAGSRGMVHSTLSRDKGRGRGEGARAQATHLPGNCCVVFGKLLYFCEPLKMGRANPLCSGARAKESIR